MSGSEVILCRSVGVFLVLLMLTVVGRVTSTTLLR